MSASSVASQQPHRHRDPFASPPGSLKENNPYRRSSGTGSNSATTHHSGRSSSARNHTHRPRSQSARRVSAADEHQQQHRRRRKHSHIPPPDAIDQLGAVGLGAPYHHDGPYEATLAVRQIPGRAPVDAVKWTNARALAATPAASIRDCLENHYPLQGTAMFPPGEGGLGDYEEYDVMVMDGNYKRWDHMEYRDEDRKGKGEPSYTIEEFEKRQKAARKGGQHRQQQRRDHQYEMKDGSGLGLLSADEGRRRQRAGSAPAQDAQFLTVDRQGGELGMGSSSAGRLEGLKRRFNSLRKK